MSEKLIVGKLEMALTGVGLMPTDTTEEVTPVGDQTLSLEEG